MQISSDESSSLSWTEWFLARKGNEFYCEIDHEYIVDKFNLAGLNVEVPHFNYAYRLVTDQLTEDLPDDIQVEVDMSAKHLYGLIHARYIVTTQGLQKMKEKYVEAEFGCCPRVLCNEQPVLPVGITDIPGQRSVKVYCPRCQDCYSQPTRKHESIDGAYFGTTFPHLLLLCHPECLPASNQGVQERYIPKIFGFKVHSYAQEIRKQEELRKEVEKRRRRPTMNGQS